MCISSNWVLALCVSSYGVFSSCIYSEVTAVQGKIVKVQEKSGTDTCAAENNVFSALKMHAQNWAQENCLIIFNGALI